MITPRIAQRCTTLPATRLVLVAFLLLFCAGRPVYAQTPTGAVVGTVTASTGTGLPGATVTIRNVATGFERAVPTQTNGTYVITDIPSRGNYELQANLTGFATVVHTSVTVVADQQLTVDFVLYAATSEALVVTGRVASLEQERSAVQQVIGDAMLHALPLVNRDFMSLTLLTAGFNGNPTAPSPLGQIYWSNNVLVDGASHFSKWRGAPRTFYSGYGLDTIRDIQVLASHFSAEFGEGLAAVTLAVTNSGTNTLHGSGLFFMQDGSLDDIPAFAPGKLPFRSARYGMTFGGPILKDRSHFLSSYEGRTQRSSNIVVSPVAPGARAKNDEDEHIGFFKIDHKATDRDLVTARYNGQWFDWHNEPGGISLPGTGTQYTNDVHTVLVSDTALISSRVLNQARFQFARFTDLRRDLNPSLYVLLAGYAIEGGILGPYGFGTRPENTWEGADTVSYRKSNHSIKVGGGMKYTSAHTPALPFGWGAYLSGCPGTTPGGGPAPLPSCDAFAGTSLFPSLLFRQGLASSEAVATADPKSLAVFGFAQDDWTVGPTTTFNIGVRYDIERVSNVRNYDVPTDRNNIQPRIGVAWQPFRDSTVFRGGAGLYSQQHLLGYINRVQLEGMDGTANVSGPPGSPFLPTFPNVLALPLAVLPPRDIVVVDPSFRNPFSLQATIGAERSLFGMVVGADFVYLSGHALMSIVDVNPPASNPKLSRRTVSEADATRPTVPVPNGFRKVISLANEGRSWYRALQVKFDRSVGAAQIIGSYTLARAEDQANYLLPEDSRNVDAERARADNDIRHNLSVGMSWQVPGRRRWLNGVTLSGFGVFRSNRPYTITWGDDRNGTTQNDARPDERNSGRGGTFKNVDLALGKRFRSMGKTLEVRAEAFNVASTTNYDEYVGALNSPLFGQPVSAFPRRRIQFAAIVRF